jgi:ribonuclease HII
MKRLLLAICFVLPLALTAQRKRTARNPMYAEVKQAMEQLRQAQLHKDSVTIDQLLDDEVQYGHSNGLIESKAQYIRSVMTGSQEYKSIETDSVVLKVWRETAVVRTKMRVNLIYNGKPIDLLMSIVWVWFKRPEGWRLIQRQSVKLN